MKSFIKIVAIVTLVTSQAVAFVPGEDKEITPISAPVDLPKTGFFSAATVNKIMPKNVTADSNAAQVQKDIINKSVDAIVKSPALSNTGIVQAAEKIEDAVNTEVSMKSDTGVEHKVGVRILAAQGAARVDYSGVLNASATYKPADDDVNFTVTEQISDNAKLQLSHQTGQHISSVNFNFDW